ncbi:hypothetical protein OSB04_007400 [Centaurea solstitialis]|uniref:Phytocyanin domain-containing protein n=1 Tax=Centaurea solstitialis TaxID=347529 RepID=A0AA38TWG6_9ASTR|nr:hypothetical protein OSB04_007400 [Centaurea solstitialis]
MGRSYGSSRWSTAVILAFTATLMMVMLPEVSAKRFIVVEAWDGVLTSTTLCGPETKRSTSATGSSILPLLAVFVYDRNQQDILEVNKTNYETCNAEHPVHNYTTGAGRDVVALNVTKDRYFMSSKGSCYGGMKLHVHLTPLPPPPRASPVKSHASRFGGLRSQLMIPTVLAVSAIWDSLILRI